MARSKPEEPYKIKVDFSDLKRVIHEMETSAKARDMKKDCEYCGRPMEKEMLKGSTQTVNFKCLKCGWETLESIPNGADE